MLTGLVLSFLAKQLQHFLYPSSIQQLVQAATKEQLYYSFLIIALIEEAGKFLLLRLLLLRNTDNATALQAIFISLLMSMGFAGFENAQIAYSNGLSSYSQLMLLSVFAHASFAIIMARFINKRNWLGDLTGLTIPLLLHGLFLYSLLLKANPVNTGLFHKGLFFGTVAVIYISAALLLYSVFKKRTALSVLK